MKGYKRILTLILFALVSLSGAFFGCRGRYDGVKITSDKSESGLQLYLEEQVDDGNNLLIGTISFTISGASKDAASKLKYSFEGNEESKIVKITNTKIEANTATLTLQAISGGSTTLVAMSEEGGKTCGVKIECIKQVKSMSFNSTYSPAMFNVAGAQLTINTKKIDFVPADTTQNQVTYSLKNAVDGIAITPAGIITLEKQVSATDFSVVAINTANTSLTSEISVHLVTPLNSEDGSGITIFCESGLYEDDKINLTTIGEESSVIFRVDIDTTEKITLGYKIDKNSGSINCINVEQSGYDFGVYANNIGTCKLIIQVYFDDYPELQVTEKEIEVTVVELPTTISVNGITQDFVDDIYTYYQNGLGQEYLIKIGDFFAYDKQYILASDEESGFEIRKSDGTVVNFGLVDDAGVVGGEFDILQSNTSIFVKGISPNVDSTLYIYAHGTLGKRLQLVRKLSLKTLLGSENVEPEYRTLDGEETRVFYVELGKSFELKYVIDEDTSAKNIKLLNADGSEIDDYISLDITSSSMPTITVTGQKPGNLSCKLMLENLVESEIFVIYVFVPVNYLNDENLDGGVYFKVDSPLSNRNIAEAVYTQYRDYSSLNKMVISLGATVQLHSDSDPVNATIFNIKYSSVLIHDGVPVSNSDASDYVSVYSSGYVIAKKVLPDKVIVDGREVNQQAAIKIEISSLVTNFDGTVNTVTSTKYIVVEGYVPLRDVTISKRNSTIYWNSYELLNPVQRVAGSYMDTVSLALYPNSISGNKVKIDWDCPEELTIRFNEDKTAVTVMAMASETLNVRDSSVYTVTATIQYYTTTIVRRFTLNVLKAVRAKTLTAYVQDGVSQTNTVAYFEVQGANNYYPESKQIIAKVYSDKNIQNVTFNKIYYRSLDESIAVVDENGVITPVAAGKTYIHVYAEDMMTGVDDYAQYKVIEVIVADGSSKEAAFKISTEADFDKLANGPDYFYYLANDITFTHSHFVPVFNGNFDGKDHYINGIVLNEIAKQDYQNGKSISLFGQLGSTATIENLNLTFSLSYDTTNENIFIAGVANTNNGTLENIDIYYLNANINVYTTKNISFAGAIINNNGRLSNVSVSANTNIIAEQDYSINVLYVAGIALYNKGTILGGNDNYKPVSINAIQEFDFTGKIIISNRISAISSAVGGAVAENSNKIGTTSFGSGLAVDIMIRAENLDNVGGLAGVNTGSIQDALVNVDIVGRNNVGGAVGNQYLVAPDDAIGDDSGTSTIINEKNEAQLYNVIVEMYDNIDGVNFGKVQGNERVGGLAGNVSSYFKINSEDDYNYLNVYYSYISHSYVYAYSTQSGIFGTNNVGGLVGKALLINIEKCYANTKISAEDGKIIGGLVGTAQNLLIDKAYSIVDCQNKDDVIFGSIVGKISKYGYIIGYGYTEKSQINEAYSTDQGVFVAEGTLNDDYVIGDENVYDGTNDLTDINTYPQFKKFTGTAFNEGEVYFELDSNNNYVRTTDNQIDYSGDPDTNPHYGQDNFDPNKDYYIYSWKIDNVFRSNNDWLISADENDGYPTLIYNSLNLMRKLQPTQIFISCVNDYEDSTVINDELIILNTEKVHRLSDILKISTDVSSRATIYVYSSIDGVLNTRNTTNKLTNNTSIQSNTEQIVTLTFILGNNISITKSVQIAFVRLAKVYDVNNLRIKKGDSHEISANVSFDSVENIVALNSENYKLGILKSDITDVNTNEQYIQISNSESITIGGEEYLLFNSGVAVLGKENVRKSGIPILLFYVLNYNDLNDDAKTEYIQVIKDLEDPEVPKQVQEISINVYSGASSIYASTTNIDMTIIDEVSFKITVKTDDIDAKLYIDPANENIYCNYNNLGSYVVLSQGMATYQQNIDDAKVELYVLNSNDKIIENGTLEITFAIRFLDKYFRNEKFNKEFTSQMKFWAEKGYNSQSGATEIVSTEINLKAMPQWLLKIDINNYPAGKNEGGNYVPVSVPANTLTPGQVGLMVIDIYPEYAYYDQIEVVSSEDADGNYISFIQVAQNVGDGNQYVELKPNTNIIDKGLVLMPYSTISFENGAYSTAFDGRFYVKTLMGTNVKYQEEIIITVTGLTYQIDEDGNYVLDENGDYVVSRSLIKTLTVVVNPAPEVAISVKDKVYTSPVYVKDTYGDQVNYKLAGEYNLILADTLYKMQIELKNGLVATRSQVDYAIYERININSAGEIDNGRELENNEGINVGTIDADTNNANLLSFNIGFTNKLKTGNIVEIWVYTYKTINGFTETYTSNRLKFLIVDKILTGLNINNSETSLNFTVNEPKNLHAQLEYTSNTTDNNGDIDNKDLNDNGAYWAGYNSKDKGYNGWGWGSLTNRENEIISARRVAEEAGKDFTYNTPTINFENYIAYKTVDEDKKDENGHLVKDENGNYITEKEGSFGITATNNSINISKFKVELCYYYVQETIGDITTCTLQVAPDAKTSEGIQKDHVMTLVREINMNISVKTTIDEPLTVYTIDDFYSMQSDRDYILMNDLYFGNGNVPTSDKYGKIVEGERWSRTYTPFEFDANSFDGNMHRIHFYGDYFNITTDGAGKQIIYINDKEETVANIGLFTTINAEKIVKDLDIEYHTISSESNYAINIDKETTMPAGTINFGGLAVTNNGIVSNVFIYFDGDININTNDSEGQVNIAGFVYQNSGKITYSAVYGPNWNNNDFKNNSFNYHNVKFQSYRTGNIATFACTNAYLISNCETNWIGIESLAPASRNARIAGFVVNNSGRIYNSSSAGQVLEYSPNTSKDKYVIDNEDFYGNEIYFATAIGDNDERLAILFGERKDKVQRDYDNNLISQQEYDEKYAFFEEEQNQYFAKLSSNGNIAGFVYKNSGEIENAYTSYPMQTGARTAGFVFDNSNAGSVITSYTVCYYDGVNTNNSAYAPFVGTNDLGEVLNDESKSVVKYSYYILDEHEVYEEDSMFKEPASRISLSPEDDNVFSNSNSFVGFDKGKLNSIWNVFDTSDYLLPILNPNLENRLIRDGFIREYIQFEKDGVTQIKFTRVSNESNPYQIADAQQFINVFNEESTWFTNSNGEKVSGYLNHSIRLINDINLTDFTGTEELNNIRKVVYMGDFDGNGMIISGINLVGSEELAETENPVNKNIFSNVSSSYGLFNQIGTATVSKLNESTKKLEVFKYAFSTKADDLPGSPKLNSTRIRNLTLKVNDVAQSTSAYTGILAGVIINTDIQSVKIQSNNVSVLGKNVVGGLAGGIFGDSKIYSVSVNANVTSSYQSKSNNLYKDPVEENGRFKLGEDFIEYKFRDYSTETISEQENHEPYGDHRDNYINSTISPDNYGFGYDEENGGKPYKIDLASKVLNCSYAGGVAGIVDLYDDEAMLNYGVPYQGTFKNESGKILNRTPNMELLTVYGDITISAEIVGGVAGSISEDTYLGNIVFEVSNSNSQKLSGLFTSGGIVGINNGGIIQLSKVELPQASSASNDNALTNQTGNYLFDSSNIYPYAVGGIVGVERGGYLLSDYSKANIISPNATYVGGIVGYLTDYQSVYTNVKLSEDQIDDYNGSPLSISELKLGRYVLMEEVYTTGNVFAGDGYKQSEQLYPIYKMENGEYVLDAETGEKIVEKEYYLFTPTSYAGGIVGCYAPKIFTGQANYDSFNSVMGINAFHIPANYVVSSNYTLDLDNNKTGPVKYSDLMNGYNGKRTLSNGMVEYAQFLPRLGSIFGKVEWNIDIDLFKYENGRSTESYYFNLYTNYVYNSTTITQTLCENPKDSTGANLNYIAYGTNGSANITSDLIYKIKNPNKAISRVDYYTYSTGSAETQKMHVNINAPTKSTVGNIENVLPSEAYLVIRALTTYRKYSADDSGIYNGWDNNWVFKSPVYPTFKPKDWNRFIDIDTEQGLRQIRSGNKYRIIRDIYLTYEWDAKNLNHITLISAKRDDNQGIVGKNSKYYAIYNINMIVDGGTQNSYGFFGELRYSNVKYINFVYGTNIDNPYTGAKYGDYRYTDEDSNQIVKTVNGNFGFRYSGTASNIGLFAGSISRNTSIEGCSIYLNTDIDRLYDNATSNFVEGCSGSIKYEVDLGLKENPISLDKNVGVMIGYVRDGSSASGNVIFGSMSRTTDTHGITKTEIEKTDLSSTTDYNFVVTNESRDITDFNVGGFIGKLESAKLEDDIVNSLALKFVNKGSAEEINVGGALGIFESTDNNILNTFEIGASASVKILVEGQNDENNDPAVFKTLSVGGLYGHISCSVESLNKNVLTCEEIKLVNITAESDSNSRVVDTEGLYVGGFAGRVNSSKISDNSSNINVKTINIGNVNLTDKYIGGLIGYLEGNSRISSMSNSTDASTKINLSKISGRNFVGGAFGYISLSSTIEGCSAYFDTIDIPNLVESITISNSTIIPTLNVGGFVGGIPYDSAESQINKSIINNSFAKGNINFLQNTITTTYNLNIGGFVADGASTNSIQSINKIKVSNSISDVAIKLKKVANKAKIAGFVANGIEYFANCASLGDIEIEDYMDYYYLGIVAGFAAYEISTGIQPDNPCYSLSTIKAVSRYSTHIVATDTSYNNNILYNYNLSGVFSDEGKETNTTGQRTYLELCGECYAAITYNWNGIRHVRTIFEGAQRTGCSGLIFTISKNNSIVKMNYVSADYLNPETYPAAPTITKSYYFDEGTKIRPKTFSTSVTPEEDKYYVVTDYLFTSADINGNLIANDKSYAPTLDNAAAISIGVKAFVSGISFSNGRNSGAPIYQNYGYVFNCVAIGQIYAQTSWTSICGFVYQNDGLINGCGTNIYLNSQNKTLDSVGFVNRNRGIIANSYASNVFLNTVASNNDESFCNIGFVKENNDGLILNCYSNPSFFDLLDDNGYLMDSTQYFKTNTKKFYSNDDSIYYSSNGFVNCETYAIKTNDLSYFNYQVSYSYMFHGSTYILFNYTKSSMHNDKGREMYNESINYGMATPFSYNVVGLEKYSNETMDIYFRNGSLYTGDGNSVYPHKVNSFKRFKHLASVVNSHYLRFVNNIDASEYDSAGNQVSYEGYYVSGYGIEVNNLELFTLYNVRLDSESATITTTDTKQNHKSLFESEYLPVDSPLTLTNFGVVINNIGAVNNEADYGYLVKKAGSIKLTNCYVSLKNTVKIGSNSTNFVTNEKDLFFGVFAGRVINNTSLKGCFVNANIDILSCDKNSSRFEAHIGTLVGRTGPGKIENSFATGTITINNQNSANTKLYVGGLTGENHATFDYCYSNVSIKNMVNNKDYDNVKVGGYIGNADMSGYEYVDADTNYFDHNISLIDKIAGTATDTCETDYITLLTQPVFNGSEYVNYVTDKHLPLQKVFNGNRLVYNVLNIRDSSFSFGTLAIQTGSKMAPIELNNCDIISNQYYYLSDDYFLDIYSLNKLYIIGNDKAFTTESSQDYVFTIIQNSLLSGFKIKNNTKFADYIQTSYLYGMNFIPETGNIKLKESTYSLYYGDSLGIINNSTGSVYDSCSIKANFYADYNHSVSAFIGKTEPIIVGDSIRVDIIRNISVDAVLDGKNVSGLVGESRALVTHTYDYYQTSIMGDNNIRLESVYARNNCSIGGVTSVISISNRDSINIFGNVSSMITVRIVQGGEYMIGGVVGCIKNDMSNNPGMVCNGTVSETRLKIISWTTDQLEISASPIIGKIENNYTITISGLTLLCASNIEYRYFKENDRSSIPEIQYSLYNGDIVPDIYIVGDATGNPPLCLYHIGGFVGYMSGGSIEGIRTVGGHNNSFIVDLRQNQHSSPYNNCRVNSNIGGIVGYLNSGTINGIVNYDINLTDRNSATLCMLGGIVGKMYSGRLKGYTCNNGLVAGLNHAYGSTQTISVQDARTYKQGRGGNSDQVYGNYEAKEVPIPICVGGIVGYLCGGAMLDDTVCKSIGDVRALLQTPSNILNGHQYTGTDLKNSGTTNWFYWDAQAKLPTYQGINDEPLQARVGAICGLVEISKSGIGFAKEGAGTSRESKNVHTNNDKGSRVIRAINKDGSYYTNFLSTQGAQAGYYTLGNVNSVNQNKIYYDFGNVDPSGTRLVEGSGDEIGFKNFNYNNWNISADGKHTYTKPSYSNFNSENIFDNNSSDYYLQYNKDYNTTEDSKYYEDFNVRVMTSYIASNYSFPTYALQASPKQDISDAGAYLCYMGIINNGTFGETSALTYTGGSWGQPKEYYWQADGTEIDLKGLNLVANNDSISSTYDNNIVHLFAGFESGEKTYNRSFWYVLSDMMSKDNERPKTTANYSVKGAGGNGGSYSQYTLTSWQWEIHPYKNAVYFYPTQHWAGTVLGGVVC